MNSILECTGLTKKFGNKEALNDITFQIPRGKIVGLLGPNGSGKTTMIKLANGLLTPTSGTMTIAGMAPSVDTKRIVSYLPERTYLSDWMTVTQLVKFFSDFYEDFNSIKAFNMINDLGISIKDRIKTMSKGTKEKVQLILVMSREAELYLLDEPIGGVDPAARDYILNTIIGNYNDNATVVISTHLIADIEKILDEVIFINQGNIVMQSSVDDIREKQQKSVDELFREVFKC
ncbi:MAG: ABC transporter ATP-binding protein [Eubacterium sp.]